MAQAVLFGGRTTACILAKGLTVKRTQSPVCEKRHALHCAFLALKIPALPPELLSLQNHCLQSGWRTSCLRGWARRDLEKPGIPDTCCRRETRWGPGFLLAIILGQVTINTVTRESDCELANSVMFPKHEATEIWSVFPEGLARC